MPAYVVALIQSITDMETYKRYVAQVEATLVPFGGRFLARKPDPALLEGGPAPSRAIILEFPDEEKVRAWHASPGYQPVLRMRQSASTATLLLLPGYVGGGAPRVAVGDAVHVEMVTPEVDATRRLCEQVHGWTFAEPDAAMGGSVVATLASGTRVAIRAPMHDLERPLTRAYVRVADADEAVRKAERAGAQVALPPVEIPGHGRVAIWLVGGVEQGVWETA